MITLHFNPQYDSGAWSGEPVKGFCRIEDSYVGPLGLLTWLEVRLGITAQEKAQHEMLATYTKAAQQAANKNSAIFFAKSIQLTSLATADELLKWRDELVLSGWKVDTPIPEGLTFGAKAILRGLAEVESALPAGFRTTADRWRILLAFLEKVTALDGFTVKVQAPEDHMHPVHRAVLNHLRRCGVSVDNVVVMREPEVEIKHFHDSSDACLWAAAQDRDALLVCADDQTLSSAMAAFGRPYGSASASETPRPVTHFFTSAMMLLKDGGDILAYRDYLAAPSHPLNRYQKDDRNLRETLLRSVVRDRGFAAFDQIIKDFAEGNSARLESILAWIPKLNQPLTYNRVKAMCEQISDWAKKSAKGVEEKGEDSPYLDQWKELVSASEEMMFQCEELGFNRLEHIPELDFIQVLRTISAPTASVARRAVVESAPVVPSIERIAVDVQDVIWVDGSFTEAPNPLSFLCPKDISELKETLPDIWLQDDALRLADDLFLAGLSRIGGKLTALYCDSFLGEKREKHPFILRKAKTVDSLAKLGFEKIPAAKSEPCPSLPIEQILDPVDLEISNLTLPDHMTPTKLEEMFDQPLDWVLKSILHLYEESDSNDSLIMGMVAHDTIRRIYEKAAGTGAPVDADAFERVFKADFDAFFAEAVLATGAELNLQENKLEREQLKSNLWKTSIPELIDIIRSSNLTIVGSEVESGIVDISEPGYEPLKITGTIDLLLKDQAGQYVILDFKWAGKTGSEMRKNQIRKGTDYQLALYRKLVETGTKTLSRGNVAAQAFFLLRTAELLTASCYFFDKNGRISPLLPGPKTHQNTYKETLEEIRQKYSKVVRDFLNHSVSVGNLKAQYLHYKALKGKID
jgi:RecB family exonuclease